MKLDSPILAGRLAEKLMGRLIGPAELELTGINEIHHVQSGDISFVDHPKYYDKALQSAASLILIDQQREAPAGKALIVVDHPFQSYNRLVEEQRPPRPHKHLIDPSASIGPGTIVEDGAIIGPQVVIGNDCYIQAHAVIREGSRLGNGILIQSGAIIGGEAFYYKKTGSGFVPWRSGGHVVIEDGVEIGPGCTIARGVSTATRIGEGSKLDAQVQVGHDCRIGKHCIIAAQVGIAGNTKIGDWCLLQGQVGIAQNLVIGDRVTILAKSGVMDHLETDGQFFGYPAQQARSAFRDLVAVRNLRKSKK